MRYHPVAAVNAAYELVANLYERDDRQADAMTIAGALLELGEERSWASVWWAYGAIHHELSDDALASAQALLAGVDGEALCRAAALMLQAEVETTVAAQHGEEPPHAKHYAMLREAIALAPDWPSLHVRIARAAASVGDMSEASLHARRAVALIEELGPSDDPFDSAISGRDLSTSYVIEELRDLGLLSSP